MLEREIINATTHPPPPDVSGEDGIFIKSPAFFRVLALNIFAFIYKYLQNHFDSAGTLPRWCYLI